MSLALLNELRCACNNLSQFTVSTPFFLAFPTPDITFCFLDFFSWLQLAWNIMAKQKCIASGSDEVTALLWHQSIKLTISERITESFLPHTYTRLVPCPICLKSSSISSFLPNPGTSLSDSSTSPGEKPGQEWQGGDKRDSLHPRAPLCQCWHNRHCCVHLSLSAYCVLISRNPFLHRLLL